MAKYKLVSKYGNEVVYTDSEREKNNLLEKGFHIDEEIKPKEKIKTEEKKPKTKKKVETENEGNANN